MSELKTNTRPGFRTCTGCKIEKEANTTIFVRQAHVKADGLAAKCRLCANELARQKAAIECQTKIYKRKPVKKPSKEGHKFCRSCDLEKELSEFRKKQDSHYHLCKLCESIQEREKRLKNPQKHKNIAKRSREKNRETINAKARLKYAEDPEYREQNQQKSKNWISNPENRAKANENRANRMKNDPVFRVCFFARHRITLFLQSKPENRSHSLGCTHDEFRKHIESQFQPGMSWDNYGLKSWHLDHIYPLSKAYDLGDEVFKAASSYKNIRPEWASANISKRNKIPPEFENIDNFLKFIYED